MEECYKEAFVEVLDIINHTELELVNKISKKFIDFLDKNKSLSYKSQINFNNINWQETVKPQTQEVIALIYRDYLVTDEKRIELAQEEEREFNEKYSYENLFKTNKITAPEPVMKQEELIEENSLVVVDEKWYSKIFKFVKNLFSKK